MEETSERAKKIIAALKKEYPDARIILNYSNPWELLVATILSAQTTDIKVNEVTKSLFKKYRSVEDFAQTPLAELEKDIQTIGLYRNKAKFIKSSAQTILDKHHSQVPKTMQELTELPGVARKTANIVLGNAFGIVEGIAVDTHVKRLAQRLGLSRSRSPEKIEKDLMKVVPKKDWFKLTYLLIDHGRAVCKAQKPHCDKCVLNEICPSAFKVS
jgi:endonuclease-3